MARDALAAPALPRRRRLVFAVTTLVAVTLLFELGARLTLFARHGGNPYYLTYGLVANVEDHSRSRDGYTTFQPGSTKRQKTVDGVIAMQINAQGFRGRRDVTPKPPGVLRVASLGASSTFGYHVADDETYPARLEDLLSARLTSPIEVFNLGIPHARLDNVVALARHELAAVAPDVVTLYAGYNNAVVPRPPAEAAAPFRLKDWLHGHLVAWRYVHNLVKWVYLSALRSAPPGKVATANLMVPLRLTPAQIRTLETDACAELVRHLDALHAEVRALDARLVVIAQAYGLPSVSGVVGDAAERRALTTRLAAEGTLPAILATRLVHGALNARARRWAAEAGVTWVDGVGALAGRETEAMASHVHLSPAGNRWLAAAIADHVVPLLQPPPRRVDPADGVSVDRMVR